MARSDEAVRPGAAPAGWLRLTGLLALMAACGAAAYLTTPSAPVVSPPVLVAPQPTAVPRVTAAPAEKTAADAPLSAVVLCYHRVAESPKSETVLRPVDFEKQLDYLVKNGYHVIPMRQLVEAARNKTGLPPKSVVLTFDDGFLTDYETVYPLLQRYQMPATLFVYTGWVGTARGASTWDHLREMVASGLVEVGSHTVTHADLVKASRRSDGGAKLRQELVNSKASIEKELGKPCYALAYPYGISNDKVRAATKAAGYEAGFSVDGGPVSGKSSIYKLGRRMVYRSDTLAKFAQQRLAVAAGPQEGKYGG